MGKKFTEYSRFDLSEINKEVLNQWDKQDLFHQSLETREGCPSFVFYEGPPSANGMPGIHHVMARSIKDIFCRYKTMKGFHVKRKAGWDTHGLPVELGVEKALGITKEDIGKTISVADYNATCRKDVMKFTREWEDLTHRMGYWVDMKNPYFIDTVYYQRFTPQTLKIMERGRRMSYITPGEQFNVVDLDEERSRISALLRNRGYFFFRPDYMTYQADTTLVPGGHISLRLIPVPGLPTAAQRAYYVGDASVYLFGKNGEAPNDSILYKNLNIHYYDKLRVRPNMLYRWMNYQQFVRSKQMRASNRTRLYSQYRQEQVQEKLSQLGIFSYLDMQYAPRDTTAACDTLDVTMQATFAKPLDAELELNVVTKSNDQTGPGASFGVTRNNVFGGGESWNVKLKGSYEWQTGGGEKSSLMNSWEMGLSTSLTFPRVVFPHLGKREFDFPATTTFRLYINQLNRAKYYKLLSFGGNATYDFQPSRTSRHSITPFKLTFNVLQHQSEDFKEIAEANPALYVSLRNLSLIHI